jgi:hypothetical protein
MNLVQKIGGVKNRHEDKEEGEYGLVKTTGVERTRPTPDDKLIRLRGASHLKMAQSSAAAR